MKTYQAVIYWKSGDVKKKFEIRAENDHDAFAQFGYVASTMRVHSFTLIEIVETIVEGVVQITRRNLANEPIKNCSRS